MRPAPSGAATSPGTANNREAGGGEALDAGDRRAVVGQHVGRHRGTAAGEQLACGEADAGAAAGDQHGLRGEVGGDHRVISCEAASCWGAHS